MRRIVLLAACFVPGFALIGCSSDGVTPNCSEVPLYHNRYDEADRAEYEDAGVLPPDNSGEDPDRTAKLDALVNENCVTALTPPDRDGGTNGGSGGSGAGGTTGGTGGAN